MKRRRLLAGAAALALCLGLDAPASALSPQQRAVLLSGPHPVLDLNFLSGSLDPRVTFTRASTGWYFNSSGLLTSASSNVARFDYGSPGSTTLQGLLIEGASENYALYSRDLTQAAWTASNVTVAHTQTGIDGSSNTASLATASSANGTVLQSITLASGTDTYSVYLKRVTGTGEIDITYNGGTNWTNVTSQINSSTWTRVSVSASVTNPSIGLRIVTNADAVAVDVSQLEQLAAASSPIITTSTAVARSADVAYLAISSFPYNQGGAGTIVDNVAFEAGAASYSTANRYASSLTDSAEAGNNRLELFSQVSLTAMGTRINASGTAYFSVNPSGTSIVASTNKVGMSWASGSAAAVLNGNSVTLSSGSVVLPTNIVYLNIGAGFNQINQAMGWLQRIRYWNVAVRPSSLQNLTH